jgi:hypothetical protein
MHVEYTCLNYRYRQKKDPNCCVIEIINKAHAFYNSNCTLNCQKLEYPIRSSRIN